MVNVQEWHDFDIMTAEEQQRYLKRKALERKRQTGLFGEIFDPMEGPEAKAARAGVRKASRAERQETRWGVPAQIPRPLQGQTEQPVRDAMKTFLANVRNRFQTVMKK